MIIILLIILNINIMNKSPFYSDLKGLENFLLNSTTNISYLKFITTILVSATSPLMVHN
jgi:hypothetical protein